MTTLEICLTIAVVYLVIMEIFNFIATKDSAGISRTFLFRIDTLHKKLPPTLYILPIVFSARCDIL